MNVDMRILPGPTETAGLTTDQLRAAFLAQGLFDAGQSRLMYCDADRLAIGGVVPLEETPLAPCREFGTTYFTERREVGLLNLGGRGAVAVGGVMHEMERFDCLYIGTGEPDVRFLPGAETEPARYYLASAPAHRKCPTRLLRRAEVVSAEFGSVATASKRRIRKCIAPGVVESCQLVMGFTELDEGSVWNTMPAHRHGRRSEIYLYVGLGSNIVFHFMGTPEATRHLVVRDLEAVLSPSWSIHAGAGTAAYTFVWAMAGENQDFADMDVVPLTELR